MVALTGAGLQTAQADNGWATAGKILTGVAIGSVLTRACEPPPVYVQAAPVYVQPAPVVYQAAPVYVAAPPPVVYVQPAPVVYAYPRPVYACPPVVVYRHFGPWHHHGHRW